MNPKDLAAPKVYDAPGTYQEEMRTRRVPGNLPAELVGKIRARETNAMLSDPTIAAALVPGYTTKISKIMALSKPERLDAMAELQKPDEIKAAMVAEVDPDIVRYLAEKYGEALLAFSTR
jgi:hypothetical protein